MATYSIIGADQKEYGPVTGDQIRQWITEGRVNAQTQARSEGAETWKPLSEFLEFGGAFATAHAPPPVGAAPLQAGNQRQAAAQAVKGPAIALIVTSALNLLLGLGQLVKLAAMRSSLDHFPGLEQMPDPQMQKMVQNFLHVFYGPIGIGSNVFALAASVLVLIGAVKMLGLQSYAFALTAGILALLPCVTPCCCLGLPFGIWALVVLNRVEVKSQFS